MPPAWARIAALAVVGCVLTSCSSYNDKRGRGDAPVGQIDRGSAEVLNFPDRFANIAMKCDGHGHRVYVTTRASTSPVVVADDNCPGGRHG